MPRFQLLINSDERSVEVPAGTLLIDVLRDELGLTGAKYGCGEGKCGACVVLVGGEPAPSCRLRVEDIGEREIVTAEGLDPHGAIANAFVDEHALQCGYCTPGLVVAATALLARSRDPSDAEIRSALTHHLCRCGAYGRVVRAVHRAAEKSR